MPSQWLWPDPAGRQRENFELLYESGRGTGIFELLDFLDPAVRDAFFAVFDDERTVVVGDPKPEEILSRPATEWDVFIG